MNIPAILVMLIIALSQVTCKSKIPFEEEPNNNCGISNEFAINSEIKGFINSTEDRDFFRIEVTENQIQEIRLSGIKGVNLSMKLWRWAKNPVLLKIIDDNRKSSPEEFANFYTEPGIYCISIEHGIRDIRRANTETPYILALKSRSLTVEEKEPNDTLINATPIDETGRIKGYFSPAFNRMNSSPDYKYREEDWYKIYINLEDNKPVIIDINISGVDRVNSRLYFYDPDGRVLSVSDKNGSGIGESITGMGIKKSGAYYIMAAAANYGYNNEQGYELYYEIREYDSSQEIEPNDKPDEANNIADNKISGQINGPGDIDMYRFIPQSENVYYRVKVEPVQGLDIKFSLLDVEKKRLFEINNGRTGEVEVFPNLVTDKTFYILVKAAKKAGGGEAAAYTLTVDEFQKDENIETEPNDEKAKSNSVFDDHITGYISQKNDKDFFMLNYNEKSNMDFEITGVKYGKIRVSVTDPLGFIIKTVDVTGEEKVVFSEMINRKAYLIVESLKENYDFPYFIEIKKQRQ